jgi:hypothetical protein
VNREELCGRVARLKRTFVPRPLPAVDAGFSPYEAATDGQRFLVRATPEREAAQPLTVIVNWPALLKKGAGTQ